MPPRAPVLRPGTAPEAPLDPGRQAGAPSFVVAADERRRLVALALGLALEVDAVGVVNDAVEYGVRDRGFGEDVTETLEAIPRRWKVIQTVREKFTCRHCEKISQPPAPFHPTPRGWAGPNLLATIVFEKYGQHQPLNRQRDRYAREGVDLSLSTLADQVGACTVALRPLHDLIASHVLAAERLHGDDTPVPVLARGKTATARAWVYVRDDAPFGGPDPPAALFRYSRDRSGDHRGSPPVGWTLQAQP